MGLSYASVSFVAAGSIAFAIPSVGAALIFSLAANTTEVYRVVINQACLRIAWALSMPREHGMRNPKRRAWSMKLDRDLTALSKMHTLQAIANRMRRSPATILTAAARLGLSIQGRPAKGKK